MLHRMNPLRVQYIRDKLLQARRDDGIEDSLGERATTKPFKGLRALDVGCGGGLLTEVNALRHRQQLRDKLT